MTGRLLVTLPFAGAHKELFLEVSKTFLGSNPGSSILNHAYPGHGRRIRVELLPTVKQMAEDCAEIISQRVATTPAQVSLVGYSMGAVVAFELCSLLISSGVDVTHCAFMASMAPHKLKHKILEVGPDEALIKHCEQYGLIQANAFASEEVRRLFLPSLRNDIHAVNEYARCSRSLSALPASVQVAIFSGRHDRTVSDSRWDELIDGPASKFDYDGGHFFFFDSPQMVGPDLNAFLSPALGREHHGNS